MTTHTRCQPEADGPRQYFPTPWNVDPFTASMYSSDAPKGPARVADMRGWGYLTGKGHGALALSQDEAIDIQRANAAFIVEAVNNYERLTERVKYLEATEANKIAIQRAALDRIEKIAFDIPAPNPYTPQIVQLCVAARNSAHASAVVPLDKSGGAT